MKTVTMILILFATMMAHAGLEFKNSSNALLGTFATAKCGTGVTCTNDGAGVLKIVSSPVLTAPLSISGDVTQTNGGLHGDGSSLATQYGYVSAQVAATATTITAAQCGKVFYNTGAVLMNLPEASTVIGCKLTFVTLNAANFDINPDDADQILVLTNAAGDAIRNATLGNTVVLQAVSASQWVEISAVGTWSDIN